MPSRLLNRLPSRLRSVRFRLALLYSVVLFGLAALLVGGLYAGLQTSLRDEPVARRVAIRKHVQGSDGRWRPVKVILADYRDFEREVNAQTLDRLARYSFGALGGLFVASIGVGWMIAGRVLRPIEVITGVASEIQATDLSRRINQEGPEDELKRLADCFDGMLGRLETAFAAQRQFVADASHELRNPLATIRATLDLVSGAGSAEEGRNLLEAARRAAERMSRLVEDLLALAREGTPLARREPIRVAEALRQVAEEFDAAARRRRISIEEAAPEELTLTGDPDAVRRALANLVDNAVRLAPEGSTVRLRAGDEGPWAWLAVSDEGPGMTQEQVSRAFDRFWRADDSRSRAGGGAGLGLAIVRQIAEAHRGAARVVGEPGGGSTFVVWLPTRPGAGTPPAGIPASLGPRPGTHPGPGDGPGGAPGGGPGPAPSPAPSGSPAPGPAPARPPARPPAAARPRERTLGELSHGAPRASPGPLTLTPA